MSEEQNGGFNQNDVGSGRPPVPPSDYVATSGSQPQATQPQAVQTATSGSQSQVTQPQAVQTAPSGSQPQATQPQATQPQAVQTAPQATQPQTSQIGSNESSEYGQQPFRQGSVPYAQHSSSGAYNATTRYASAPQTANKASLGKTFAVAFLGAALACSVTLGGYTALTAGSSNGSSNGSGNLALGSATSSTINASDENQTLAEAVAAKALPSMVCIYAYTNQSSAYGFFGMGTQSNSDTLTQSSLGSGIVLTADGYILTNYHVIEDSAALKVSVEGGEYDATVIGTDASSDLAVIKLDGASGLTPADIGDSDNLTVGEWVMSVGSPFGLEQSVATGVVSATSRSEIINSSSQNGYNYGSSASTTIYPNMIQTDAAINPGNSGGALVDSDGKVIGVNTLITSYSGNYSGVGFAIPINYAIALAEQMIAGETPSHAQLGVSLSTVNSQNAQRYGLSTNSGAYISSVAKGSGADEAGVEEGDIVTSFGGKTIKSASDLMVAVREHKVGDTVEMTINRNGKEQTVSVKLGSDSATAAASSKVG